MSGHKIPPLRGYFNTVATMDDYQLDFYHLVADGLAHGRHVHIDGQVGYVFAYLYGVLALWQKRSFESLHDYLTQVSELYSEEPKVHGYCLAWAADCLLATKQFELFLDRTIPKTVTSTQTHRSNLRLNVQHHLGLRPDPVDIVTTLKARTSKTIRANEGQYRDALTEVLDNIKRSKETGSTSCDGNEAHGTTSMSTSCSRVRLSLGAPSSASSWSRSTRAPVQWKQSSS